MIGDGVNDAPALRRGEIGITVADATDAARSASDIVFSKPGLSVIISAVLTSRAIFHMMVLFVVKLPPTFLERLLSVLLLEIRSPTMNFESLSFAIRLILDDS
ncbi:hypothetical protein AHAS_Ahas14G0144000 [Arachis hypogaea]